MKLMTKILTISLALLFLTATTVGASIPKTSKISENDSTAGYLNGKLVAGSGVSFTENNDGGDETLTIAASEVSGSSINWSSINGLINSSSINWTNINSLSPIQSGGINWSDIHSGEIQRAGVNWSSVVATDIPTLNQNTTGNAATATALAANGTNCSAGSYALGVDASGNAEGCTAASSGSVTEVTATSPVTSSGGSTPDIGFNWNAVSGIIKASNINWTDVNILQNIQSSGINWDSLNKVIESAGINWSSITNGELQTSGMNWSSVVNGELQSSGINWSDIANYDTDKVLTAVGDGTVQFVSPTTASVNWDAVINGEIWSAGINWLDVNSMEIQDGAFNWSSITDFANGYVLQGVTGGTVKFASPSAASVNWSDIVHGEIQKAGINWADIASFTEGNVLKVSSGNVVFTPETDPVHVAWYNNAQAALNTLTLNKLIGASDTDVNIDLSPAENTIHFHPGYSSGDYYFKMISESDDSDNPQFLPSMAHSGQIGTASSPFKVIRSDSFVGALTGNASTVTNGVYTTDAGSVFLAPNGNGSSLTGVIHGGGRSLTTNGTDLDADAELYTATKTIYIEYPTATDDLKTIWTAPLAVTITKISCESDQTVNFDLQVDDGSPAAVNGSDIACTTFATDSSLAGDTTMAAGDRLDLAIASVSGTPTWVSVSWEFIYND